jgi:4-aminobutyrate aminotransferase/(S)-3-amino-2-methylpropionate transaminase
MSAINIRTAIPGPLSAAWEQRRRNAVPSGAGSATPVFIASGEGAVLEDLDGNTYLDFAGGIGCMNVGHRAPAVVEAVQQQMERFTHLCFSVTPYDAYVRLAEELNRRSPGSFAKKTMLVSTGVEAVENAVKIARAYTKRPAVIAFEDAFHGRTLLGMTLTSKVRPYKAGLGPFAPEVYRIPYAYCYRCSEPSRYPECEVRCAGALEDAFRHTVEATSVAAVLVEPVLGEGGFVSPPAAYFQKLRDICSQRGIVLIVDEVQTGYGRTGTFFACEQLGLEPDIVVTAKSIAAGLPLGAVTGRAEIMDAPAPGAIGGTYVGNPLACEAALAVLKIVDEQHLVERASQIGEWIGHRTRAYASAFPLIGEIRGRGAMRAFELVRDRDTREAAKQETEEIIRYCWHRGVIVLPAGTRGNVIRLLLPLVITDEQLDEGFSVLEAALASVGAPAPVAVVNSGRKE